MRPNGLQSDLHARPVPALICLQPHAAGAQTRPAARTKLLAGAGAAAAMRRGKCFVQINVHGINAQIAGRTRPTMALKLAPSQ